MRLCGIATQSANNPLYKNIHNQGGNKSKTN